LANDTTVTAPFTYWRTVRHLRREQIWGRLSRLVPRAAVAAAPAPPLRVRGGWFGQPILRSGPIRQGSSFSFLNRSAAVLRRADWNDGRQAQLWRYNLHYFDWLREQAARQRVADDAGWLDRWIADNPLGEGAGWEPYPLSIRIVNWTVWFITCGSAAQAQLDSLANQVRCLARSIEYHLLGNHLFANAEALVFAGTFFAGEEADRWRTLGIDLLRRELPEQILADGAHFELSPMYHCLILEDLLDLLGLGAAYPDVLGSPLAALGVADAARKMAHWLKHVLHPDGQIPYFNDAALDVAPGPAQLFAYAASRGVSVPDGVALCTVLQPSGYAVMSHPPLHVIFDCGRVGPDYLPGHAHADTLSFELSAGAERVISNSGTSTYEKGPEREWERSTRAHATVEIDGLSSAETWASFRVGRRPNVGPIEQGRDGPADWVECRHDGYRHLTGSPMHRRRVAAAPGHVRITDWIEGAGEHDAAGFLPIHPGVRVEQAAGDCWSLSTPQGHKLEMHLDGPVKAELRTGRFAPAFGITVPRPVLEWRWHGRLPVRVEIQFRLAAW
jgi:uncharacterized heparinase superfamily protein